VVGSGTGTCLFLKLELASSPHHHGHHSLQTALHRTEPTSVHHGRATAQAVSRRLPTAEARVRSQIMLCGICGIGAGFLRVPQFPLSILIPPTAPHSSSINRGWYNRPNSGRRTKWAQSHSKLNSVALVRKRTIPTERLAAVGEVVPNFAGRGCYVVSATDSHGR
jgi:hypothetical protein